MKIVVADNEPAHLMTVERMLREEGYEQIVTASSASELFDHFAGEAAAGADKLADLILMDVMMQGIDGIEICRMIRSDSRLMDIPVIIVTALGDSYNLAEALDAGAIDYVMKPINKIELLARIRVALRLKYEKDRHRERDKKISMELELARKVQESVLSSPIADGSIQISALYEPSDELAGDMYAWHRLDRDRYGVVLVDVMGHGISSSLVCMFISSVIQPIMVKHVDPVKVMQELNSYMTRLHMEDQFISYYFTAIYLVVDTEMKTVEYVNAGHPPGLLLENNKKPIKLDQGSCAIGFFDEIDIRKGTIRYTDPMKIILYTDGLTDLLGQLNGLTHRQWRRIRHYGHARTITFLKEEIIKANTSAQQDDICLVLINVQ